MTSETAVLFALRSATYDAMPPSNLKSCVLVGALVVDDDLQAAVEVRELAQLLRELLEGELEDVLEDLAGRDGT